MKLNISEDLAMPAAEAVCSTFLILGGKGMGKTNLGSVLAEELHHCKLRFSVIDPLDVWYGLQHGKTRDQAGLDVVILGGPHGDIPIEPLGGAVVADFVADEDVSTVIVMRRADGSMWTNGERVRFMTDYCSRLYLRQGEHRRPLMQIIDEAGRFVPQISTKGDVEIAKCIGAIEQLVEWGRNVGVGVTLITQRSARINKSVSELADVLIAFRTVGPLSVDAVMDWFGEHVEKSRHKVLVEQLRSNDRGVALVVSPGWLKFEGSVRIRPRETFDSSATPKPGHALRVPGKAAKPDLAKYTERMRETVERATADDPKTMRATIRELQVQLTKAQKAQPAPARDDARLADIRRTAIERERVWTDRFKELERRVADRDRRMAKAARLLEQSASSFDNACSILRGAGVTELQLDSPAPAATAEARRQPAMSPKLVSGVTGDVSLSKGERHILQAVAEQEDVGATREQLTVLTGYKRSTRDQYLKQLRAKGLTAGDGNIRATEAGLQALGDFQPLPAGDALRELWLQRLPGGERRVLEVVSEQYPQPISRDEISEATSFKRSTRDQYLKQLKARRLIEIAEAGKIVASRQLFSY